MSQQSNPFSHRITQIWYVWNKYTIKRKAKKIASIYPGSLNRSIASSRAAKEVRIFVVSFLISFFFNFFFCFTNDVDDEDETSNEKLALHRLVIAVAIRSVKSIYFCIARLRRDNQNTGYIMHRSERKLTVDSLAILPWGMPCPCYFGSFN